MKLEGHSQPALSISSLTLRRKGHGNRRTNTIPTCDPNGLSQQSLHRVSENGTDHSTVPVFLVKLYRYRSPVHCASEPCLHDKSIVYSRREEFTWTHQSKASEEKGCAGLPKCASCEETRSVHIPRQSQKHRVSPHLWRINSR